MQLSTGPWVRLYGFNREVVLNAQLQAVLSLLQYAAGTGDSAAGRARATPRRIGAGDVPAVRHGRLVAVRARGHVCDEGVPAVRDAAAREARAQTQDPFWVDASQRFHGYYYDPPDVVPGPAPPTIYPQPLDGFLDVAQIPVTLSQNASVTLAVGGNVSTFRLTRGAHTLTWTPPAGVAPGTYPVQIAATNRAGRRKTVKLAPVVVAVDAAPTVTAQLASGALAWQATDPGTPSLALHVDFVDPTGVNPPQTVDLGSQPLAGERTARRSAGDVAGEPRGDEHVRARDHCRPRLRHRVGGESLFLWLDSRTQRDDLRHSHRARRNNAVTLTPPCGASSSPL